jgi:hypothetical protein
MLAPLRELSIFLGREQQVLLLGQWLPVACNEELATAGYGRSATTSLG